MLWRQEYYSAGPIETQSLLKQMRKLCECFSQNLDMWLSKLSLIPPFISIVLQIQLFFLFCYLLTKLITTIKAFKSHHSLKFTMTYYQAVFSKPTYSSSVVFKMTDSVLCQENFRITTSIILRVYHWKNIEKYRKDRN